MLAEHTTHKMVSNDRYASDAHFERWRSFRNKCWTRESQTHRDSHAMQISPVLSDQYLTSQIAKITVCVLQIDDKKQISTLLPQLSHLYPWTENWAHLKRVRTVKQDDFLKYQIIVTKAEDVDRVSCEFNGLGEIITVEVPEKCPLTRTQFENCRKLWPTNFHENKHISNCLLGRCFDEQSRERIAKNFERLASFSLEKDKASAALAINNGDLIELSTSDCNQPLKHAIISLIDCVAKKHLRELSTASNENPYLLTGCDVFVTEEPCIMCTMALIHSRVKRLFFVDNMKKYSDLSNCPPDGAISSAKLHVHTKLNHHFEAWKVSLNN